MSDQVSIKEFKSIIKSAIEEELEEIGESTSNTIKTGYFFAQWVHNLIEEYDGGYAEYAEIPEVKDKGVDFVLVDRQNKRVLIAQCKSIGLSSTGSKPAKKEDVMGFWSIHELLMEEGSRYLEDATEQAVQMLEEYPSWVKQGFEITWRYITLEKRPTGLDDQISNLSSHKKIPFKREVWGISELKDYFRQTVSLSDSPPEEISISLKDDQFYEKKAPKSKDNVNRTIIGSIGGNELANLYRKEKNSLFAYNIRQFLGKPNNKKIIETAQERGDQFFYFNNGITAICSKYERSKNLIKAYDFQVINGAQTVGSITAASNSGIPINDVEVMIRIVETGELKTQRGFNRDIVTFNNTQNKVETWDFVSNDDIQQYLGKTLRNDNKQLGYKFSYQRKRIEQQKQSYKKVRPELLAKIMYSITYEDFDPYIPTNEGKGKLVQTSEVEGGLYDEIFKPELNKWTSEYLDAAHVGIQMYFKLKAYFAKLKSNEELKKVQGLKFHHIALMKHILDKKEISLTKLRKDPATLNNFYDEYAEKVIKQTHISLVKFSKDKEGTNVFRNFARDKIEFESMKSQAELLL